MVVKTKNMSAKGLNQRPMGLWPRSSFGRKYKALFLDLDGTMVLPGLENVPSKKVTDAINKVKGKIHVCMATGRIFPQIQIILDHLELTGLCVIANGIQIYDPQRKKMVWERKLNKKSIPTIYSVMKKYDLEVRQFNGLDEFLFDGDMNREDVYSLWADRVAPEITEKIFKELSHISDVSAHKMASFHDNLLSIEISHAEASKLHGIVEVAKRLGIDTHEMIGVGDSYNDFPLLMACGLKIAMGNAVPELKAIADFIAPSVEEDGVATIIEKFILS